MPGVVAAPLEISMGEASNDGVEGYGAFVTVRLETEPTDGDVVVRISPLDMTQVSLSASTVVFRKGEDDWKEGKQIKVDAIQDNKAEATAGKAHTTKITMTIDATSKDSVYQPGMSLLYGDDTLPLIDVSIYDPAPNTIPPPQITNVRFHSSLTYLSMFFAWLWSRPKQKQAIIVQTR